MTNAVQTNTSTNATVSSNAYNYDPAGNRLAETTASGTTAGQFNNLNQLIAYTGSTTSTTVAGHTSAPISSATVNAVPATITSSTNFTANVPLPAGTNVVSVVAQPISGAAATQREQIIATGAAPTALSYDANGNTLIDEKGYAYTWDALNRMISITYPSGASTLFAYDGLSRRISIIEKDSAGTVASTKNYLWIGSEIAEERDSSNTVQKRFFPQGEQQGSSNFYYTRDHEGSIHELVDGSGNIQARYSYDPYGRTTKISGTLEATFQYTGDYRHQTSGLNLTLYRVYDTNTARWLSRDPIEEKGGNNLYEYCLNSPVVHSDPFGLITLDEAEDHWRNGNGAPMRMSFDEIDTSDVTPTSFPEVNSKVVRCAKGTHQIDARTAYVTHGDIWYVLGTITLRLQGTLTIDNCCCWTFTGTLKSFDDEYGFEMHGNDPARDVATLMGHAHAGRGTPFMIQIRGSKSINAHGCFKGTSRRVNGL